VSGTGTDAEGFGVYVHVPFCRERCDFCAFATFTDRDPLMGRYVDACLAELEAAAQAGLPAATSVYVGGGTPSRLAAEELVRLLGALDVAEGAEVTVECHPDDVDPARLGAYKEAGVTRVSIGVQSTVPAVLASLGRPQGPGALERCAEAVTAVGFPTWSVDLIFGAAAERDEDWAKSLADVVAVGPPHLSTYGLTVEPGTALARDRSRHPEEDVQARRYELADRVLHEAGYEWEEISNWARPGHRCRHNQLYWAQGDYLGIGAAAHSHRRGLRWSNTARLERYLDAVAVGRSPVAARESPAGEARRLEGLSLALRTPAGVPEAALPPTPELEALVDRRAGRAVLTLAGRLLANEVARRLEPEALWAAVDLAGALEGPPVSSR
jgi:oxygen-independent coproporphyrinogen-3 oxidase